VQIEQLPNLDIIQITAESPSGYEASLISNTYTKLYLMVSREVNRDQLTLTKDFLLTQRTEKLAQLKEAENELKDYQEKGGVIALDDQAKNLVTEISSVQANINLAKIELLSSNKVMARYKEELNKLDPEISKYLEKFATEDYIKSLQSELVKLELNQDMSSSEVKNQGSNAQLLNDYNAKINELKAKISNKITSYKEEATSGSPEQVKEYSQKLIEEEIKNQNIILTITELTKQLKLLDTEFGKLPKSSIELAGLERNRESLEKLYVLVESKYQEALINEQSQPGYVSVMDYSDIPTIPSKPNRWNIVLYGFLVGLSLALGYAFIRNYFDDTVKTPEDIESRNINVLSWIPSIEALGAGKGKNEFEFIMHQKPNSVAAEAFKTLRSRVQFSKVDKESLKTILITSPAPGEGKTMIATNLAASFAQSNAKTLVLDCDFRKPRVHSFFKGKRSPGVIDYIFGNATMDKIVYPTEMENLFYIPCGQIPPNPAEILQSDKMISLIAELKTVYDYIIVDSPPIIAVTDAEILARVCDATILVVSSEQTKTDMMVRVVNSLSVENVGFIGVVLNKFDFQAGYGSYYKYYYYYYGSSKDKKHTLKV
jgi:tyrosine-protein kinase Etk/Wzc